MSGYGWSSNMHGFNYGRPRPYGPPPPPPPSPPRLSCRICSQVFSSSQALIHHIQYSHMVVEEEQAALRNIRQNFTTLPTQPLRAPPRPLGLGGGRGRNPNYTATRMVAPPPLLVLPPPTHRAEYCTKPYLDQLDKPIPQIVEVEDEDDSHSNKLDLTLRL